MEFSVHKGYFFQFIHSKPLNNFHFEIGFK